MKSKPRLFHSSRFLSLTRLLPLTLVFGSLIGCDQLGSTFGVETPAHKTARLEAEGKAVGGGCRQSGRAIEDCYSIYNWLPKDAVFAGWLEMDGYMRINKLETIPPLLPPAPPPETGKKKKKANAEEPGEGDNAASAPAGPIPVPAPAPEQPTPETPAAPAPSQP